MRLRGSVVSTVDELVFPAELRVEAFADPMVEAVGFPVHHVYVELCWLPVIGPSTTWLLRRLGWWVEACPEGVTVQLAELAGWLGIGSNVGSSSMVQRSLRRLVRFGLASWHGGRLKVRTVVPPLSERHLQRLSPSLRDAHDRLVAGRRAA
jgi:hypothetical protein